MAGHSKFKNIMHRKGAQDSKKAKKFTKVMRELIVAAKSGSIDPATNFRLRHAIDAAKMINMPKSKIDGAIKKVSGEDGNSYEEIFYSGYGPDGVAVMVRTLTDNKARTASDVRLIFSKCGAHLAEKTSLSHLFDRVVVIYYAESAAQSEDDMLSSVIDAGADDCFLDGDEYSVICQVSSANDVKQLLDSQLACESKNMEIMWRPIRFVDLANDDSFNKLQKLVDLLDANDDVQDVVTNAATKE